MERKDKLRFNGKIGNAIATALRDQITSRKSLVPIPESSSIDGKTCLVTGASSGLGYAVASQLAARGGHVIMACRSRIPVAGEEIKTRIHSNDVEMLKLDLSDLYSVKTFCDEIAARRVQLDIVVCNAGLTTATSRKSKQGYELMFAVHFLANRYMIKRFLEDGVVVPAWTESSVEAPRIIFVTSEAHRSAEDFDFNHLGEFNEFGVRESLRYYGASKMVLCTYASELSRRLNPRDQVCVAVHSLCPGAVATNIAREAPKPIKFLVKPIMKLLFRSAEKAIDPIMYLACESETGKTTGRYLHVLQEKSMSSHASNEAHGQVLWERSDKMLADFEMSMQRTN